MTFLHLIPSFFPAFLSLPLTALLKPPDPVVRTTFLPSPLMSTTHSSDAPGFNFLHFSELKNLTFLRPESYLKYHQAAPEIDEVTSIVKVETIPPFDPRNKGLKSKSPLWRKTYPTDGRDRRRGRRPVP